MSSRNCQHDNFRNFHKHAPRCILSRYYARSAAEILWTLYQANSDSFSPMSRARRTMRPDRQYIHLKIYKKLVKPRRVCTTPPAGYRRPRADLGPLNSKLGDRVTARKKERERKKKHQWESGINTPKKWGSSRARTLAIKRKGIAGYTKEENKTKQSISENRLISWSNWSGLLCCYPPSAYSRSSVLSPFVTKDCYCPEFYSEYERLASNIVGISSSHLINDHWEREYIKLYIFFPMSRKIIFSDPKLL